MKRILLALLLACATLFATVSAQRRGTKDPCADPQSQAEMNMCAAKKFKAADAELNRVYNQLVAKLGDDAGQRERLKTVETSWLKYRDDNCDYEAAAYEGGSIKPLIYSTCLERMTKSRTEELRFQIKELEQ